MVLFLTANMAAARHVQTSNSVADQNVSYINFAS